MKSIPKRFWWGISSLIFFVVSAIVSGLVEIVPKFLLSDTQFVWYQDHQTVVIILAVSLGIHVMSANIILDLKSEFKTTKSPERDTCLGEAVEKIQGITSFGRQHSKPEIEDKIFELARNKKIVIWGKEGGAGNGILAELQTAETFGEIDSLFFVSAKLIHIPELYTTRIIKFNSNESWGNNNLPDTYHAPQVCFGQIVQFFR